MTLSATSNRSLNTGNSGKGLSGNQPTLTDQIAPHQTRTSQTQTTGSTNIHKSEKSKTRDFLDKGNITINGIAAGTKVLSSINKCLNLNWGIGNFLSTSGEMATRLAMVGQSALGLFDFAFEKKNIPGALAQALEIGLSIKAEDADKWLLRGTSQAALNIISPVTKAYERLQVANKTNETTYGADYKNLPLSQALAKSISIPFNIYKNNVIEIFKNPGLIKENLTYALSVASAFMGAGGILGLTPFKKSASLIRFLGAVPADVIYALMGHHVKEGYNPAQKFDAKEMFDFKSYLGWAGKLWLVPGILDPIKRLPSLENIMDPLNDICDAFDRCAAGFYQANLYLSDTKEDTKVAPAPTS